MSKKFFYITSGVTFILLSVIRPEVRVAEAPYYDAGSRGHEELERLAGRGLDS
jgi:hypothetical protein